MEEGERRPGGATVEFAPLKEVKAVAATNDAWAPESLATVGKCASTPRTLCLRVLTFLSAFQWDWLLIGSPRKLSSSPERQSKGDTGYEG
jgi:hypothetical protein